MDLSRTESMRRGEKQFVRILSSGSCFSHSLYSRIASPCPRAFITLHALANNCTLSVCYIKIIRNIHVNRLMQEKKMSASNFHCFRDGEAEQGHPGTCNMFSICGQWLNSILCCRRTPQRLPGIAKIIARSINYALLRRKLLHDIPSTGHH